MKKGIKTLEKVLRMAIVMIVSMAGSKNVTAQQATVRYSPIFAEHYSSSNTLASDMENGKLKMSESVTELFFINYQLQSWNEELVRVGAKRENGSQYQLESEFESITEARKYFAKVLRNYCTDQDAVWASGDYKLARAEVGKTDAVTTDWVRGPKPGEKITKLDPNTIPEISQADGKFDLIDGFSLYCGNSMVKVEKVKSPAPAIVTNPGKKVIVNDTVVHNTIIVSNNQVQTGTSVWGYAQNPLLAPQQPANYGYQQPSGGNTTITYNVHDNGNTTPVVMKQSNGPVVAAMVMNGLLTAYAIWQAGRWQQYQPNQYYTVNNSSWYQYQGWQNPMPSFGPIQGTATGNPLLAGPIQGNTLGGGMLGNPIQGGAYGGSFGSPLQGFANGGFLGSPLQGNTGGNPLLGNPIQGSVWP